VAVARTVQWILVNEVGLIDDGPAVDRATVKLWKRAGGWNDDWDLSYALYCWLLAAKGSSTAERRRAASDPETAARRDRADLERGAADGRTLDWNEVRGIFEELYNGTAVATARFGVPARVRQERGLAETERVLLEAGLLRELALAGIDKVGIVTGRSVPDWEAVRARIPVPLETAVATMEDGRKPDPAPLRKVVRALRPRAFVAVGDTRSDLEMVVRWNATDEGRAAPGVAVMLCPPEDEPAYRAAGATLFIRSLADLPALLGRT
jgi:phosphoglycolate phosphatase-like HAD superfamily hydrolase